MEWEIVNSKAVTPQGVMENATIRIKDGRISSISPGVPKDVLPIRINLRGNFVYPGLINAHDHLLGTYLPKVGTNRPYLNWLPWDNDLKSSVVYAERQQLEPEQLYLLGSYKNLISGVTSVLDHIPHFVQKPFLDKSPIRILERFTLAHSICSYSLGWGDGPQIEYARAKEGNLPFVTHISEGFDEESKNALRELNALGCLGENAVLVHGIAFDGEDIKTVSKTKANLVWCPESNLFMFGKTAPIREILEAGINVSLGTDSPMSGSINIFQEIKSARDFFAKEYGKELDPKIVFKMVTENPAKALRVENDLGKLEIGKKADLLVLSSEKEDAYQTLCSADLKSVRLVVKDGKPSYGDLSLKDFFDETGVTGREIKIAGTDKYLAGDPLGLLESVTRALGYKKDLAFFPVG
ncbi:amidohydrolase family protein [Leptospira licerasiae]|uniref:Amidohydrolase n=1 Tax=Leptospira licerasiae str. MMD4847 TaxID=1049971 RepID=A0ABN0H517_9LEPT|nr:amidohydrolase family protein [Leptospira licerasiae]EIE02023.1 amidohydrolase domain protein [Leptospira licerasiae serovar Varillal str. VAR 010]EJZ40525.1 amidohydrolase [Leptospira licerasiae str. MMD4847]TGM90138.1 hydrolase [Leptospira licerasiae]